MIVLKVNTGPTADQPRPKDEYEAWDQARRKLYARVGRLNGHRVAQVIDSDNIVLAVAAVDGADFDGQRTTLRGAVLAGHPVVGKPLGIPFTTRSKLQYSDPSGDQKFLEWARADTGSTHPVITQQEIEEAASRLRGTGHWEGDLTRAQRNQVYALDVPQPEADKTWRVLWVPNRGRFGNMAEFWDLTYANQNFGRDGQFVSAYYVETLLSGVGGLILDAGIPAWRIDAAGMGMVRAWIKRMEGGR